MEGLPISHGTDASYAQAQTYEHGLTYWIRSENRVVVLKKLQPVSRDFGMTPRYQEFKKPGFLERFFGG